MQETHYPKLSRIKIGEPDANSEYFSAAKTKTSPIFLDCFFSLPQFPVEEFLTGEKYIIYGQKGTGKTSTLRYIDSVLKKDGAETDFVIFKKSFLEEIDLADFGKLPIMVDEESIKKFKHFHHTMKRLIVLMVASKIGSSSCVDIDELDGEESKNLLQKISESAFGDVIRLGMDSIASVFQGLSIDVGKATNELVLLEGTKIIKRSNDDILRFAIRRLKKNPKKIRIFLDEIHFAYRSEESLQQDAILVRDTILAIQSLNERFAEESVDVTIYIAIRAEYLEHPIISTADINHAVESVGHELTWSSYPVGKSHPLFELVFFRFKKVIGSSFSKDDFFNIYLANIEASDFLSRTWSKPRDLIRFFKCARKLYPERVMLSKSEVNAVWRNYAQESWKEIKSSASPFLNPEALAKFEEIFSQIVPAVYDGTQKYNIDTFGELFLPVYEIASVNQKNFYGFAHFIRLLYILGIFNTRRHDANEQDIFHSYHRGNRNYHSNGDVLIHPTVLKAFG